MNRKRSCLLLEFKDPTFWHKDAYYIYSVGYIEWFVYWLDSRVVSCLPNSGDLLGTSNLEQVHKVNTNFPELTIDIKGDIPKINGIVLRNFKLCTIKFVSCRIKAPTSIRILY